MWCSSGNSNSAHQNTLNFQCGNAVSFGRFVIRYAGNCYNSDWYDFVGKKWVKNASARCRGRFLNSFDRHASRSHSAWHVLTERTCLKLCRFARVASQSLLSRTSAFVDGCSEFSNSDILPVRRRRSRASRNLQNSVRSHQSWREAHDCFY